MQGKTNRGGLAPDFARRAGVVPKASTFKEKTWVHTSRTLYVTNVAAGTSSDELEGLFKDLDGFVAFRRVRSMCFVDFMEKQQATAAMWKTNGHKFRPEHDGLLVSYDKDDNEERGGWSIRKREEEKRRKAEVDATRVLYRCSACTHFCFKVARPLTDMPERKTDKSRVVDTSQDLVSLMCVKGGTKLLKREKGIEKQHRYNCELCDVCVAYRPVPYDQDSKYIYVFPEAVTTASAKDKDKPTPPGAAPTPLAPKPSSVPATANGEPRLDSGASTPAGEQPEPDKEDSRPGLFGQSDQPTVRAQYERIQALGGDLAGRPDDDSCKADGEEGLPGPDAGPAALEGPGKEGGVSSGKIPAEGGRVVGLGEAEEEDGEEDSRQGGTEDGTLAGPIGGPRLESKGE